MDWWFGKFDFGAEIAVSPSDDGKALSMNPVVSGYLF